MKTGKKFYALVVEKGSYGFLTNSSTVGHENQFKTLRAARRVRAEGDFRKAEIVLVKVVEGMDK